MWQNSECDKTQTVAKLKNSNCDKTQQLKFWQNSKTHLWQNEEKKTFFHKTFFTYFFFTNTISPTNLFSLRTFFCFNFCSTFEKSNFTHLTTNVMFWGQRFVILARFITFWKTNHDTCHIPYSFTSNSSLIHWFLKVLLFVAHSWKKEQLHKKKEEKKHSFVLGRGFERSTERKKNQTDIIYDCFIVCPIRDCWMFRPPSKLTNYCHCPCL